MLVKRILLLCTALVCLLSLPICQTASASDIQGMSEDGFHEGLDEYYAFERSSSAARNALPLTYEQISILGEFQALRFGERGSSGKFYAPRYFLIDGNNFPICVDFYGLSRYRKVLHTDVVPPGNIDMSNLEGLPSNSCIVVRGELKYRYTYGKLIDICFQHYGQLVALGRDPGSLYDYPTDGEDTFMKRLLSIDESVANAAIEELRALMSAGEQRLPHPEVFGIGVIVASVMLIALLSYRRIKGSSI